MNLITRPCPPASITITTISVTVYPSLTRKIDRQAAMHALMSTVGVREVFVRMGPRIPPHNNARGETRVRAYGRIVVNAGVRVHIVSRGRLIALGVVVGIIIQRDAAASRRRRRVAGARPSTAKARTSSTGGHTKAAFTIVPNEVVQARRINGFRESPSPANRRSRSAATTARTASRHAWHVQ